MLPEEWIPWKCWAICVNATLCLAISSMVLSNAEKWDEWDLWIYANEKKKKKAGLIFMFSSKRSGSVITFSCKRKGAAEDTSLSQQLISPGLYSVLHKQYITFWLQMHLKSPGRYSVLCNQGTILIRFNISLQWELLCGKSLCNQLNPLAMYSLR